MLVNKFSLMGLMDLGKDKRRSSLVLGFPFTGDPFPPLSLLSEVVNKWLR